MCTIVKVKRKVTDEPPDRLIIECKKKRLDLVESSHAPISDKPSDANNVSVEKKEDIVKQVLRYVASSENEVKKKRFFFCFCEKIKNLKF
jgi:hypothetical protein